jgi:hypothetical protein
MANHTWISRILILFIATCGVSLLSSCDRAGSGRVPKGDLVDAIKDPAAFYSLRGGNDYDRLPLRYPFHIVDVTGEPDLCNGLVVVFDNVTAVNVQSNLVFGKHGPFTAGGGAYPGGWFVVDVSSRTNLPVSTEAEFHQVLAAKGVTNENLLPVRPLIKEFMFKGVLPFGR